MCVLYGPYYYSTHEERTHYSKHDYKKHSHSASPSYITYWSLPIIHYVQPVMHIIIESASVYW
jgi:predicted transcriptional regulator of viral defense system